MPTTPVNALRFPASSASPNVPQDIQNLATDIDLKLTASIATMAARPTTNRVVGMTVRPLDRPAVTYVWDGAKWVQEGLLAEFVGVPDGAYVSEQTASQAFSTSNSAGGFVVPLPYPFSAAPLWAGFVQGDSTGGNPVLLAPVPGNHTATQLSGTVRNPDNTSPATGSAFRVTLFAVGYNT